MSEKKKTVIFVFGTRPELIKVYPLIREARSRPELDVIACSTGQHREMLEALYHIFEIKPDVDFSLMKPNQNLTNLHAETMLCMQKLIKERNPSWVIVQGDTTSAHAAALTAFYEKVAVGHVEAGLRTYQISTPFPEELNRRAIGLVARGHFAPTEDAALNLRGEGVDETAFLEVTGNTGIDTLKLMSEKIESSWELKQRIAHKFSFLFLERFALATVHRRENFGEPQRNILNALLEVATENHIDILFPVHPNPNVRTAVEQIYANAIGRSVFWMSNDFQHKTLSTSHPGGKIFLVEPLDYLDMVFILNRAKIVLTDSGGLQEEAPTFGKKTIVLRTSTERPEAVEAGFSELVGTDFNTIVNAGRRLLATDNHWPNGMPMNPYGDGKASERIIDLIIKNN